MVQQIESSAQTRFKRARLAGCAIFGVAVLIFVWRWHSASGTAAVQTPEQIERDAREQPEDFLAQLRYGEQLVHQRRPGEAQEVLERAGRLEPNDARPPAWMAIVAMSQHHPEDARMLLREAFKRNPNDLTAIRAQANFDAQEHRIRPAIEGFERLVRLRPRDADAWQRLGLLLMGAGENYRSLDALTRSAALDPNDLLTQRALGGMALQAGRLDQARQAFNAVLTREPGDSIALLGLAKTTMRLDPSPNGLMTAEKQATEAIAAAPTAEAYSARGQVRMARRSFQAAISDLNAAVSLSPQSRELPVLLSQCYASAGRPDLARKFAAEFERRRDRQLARDRAAGAAR